MRTSWHIYLRHDSYMSRLPQRLFSYLAMIDVWFVNECAILHATKFSISNIMKMVKKKK